MIWVNTTCMPTQINAHCLYLKSSTSVTSSAQTASVFTPANLQEWSLPTSVTELAGVSRVAHYFRTYIPQYSDTDHQQILKHALTCITDHAWGTLLVQAGYSVAYMFTHVQEFCLAELTAIMSGHGSDSVLFYRWEVALLPVHGQQCSCTVICTSDMGTTKTLHHMSGCVRCKRYHRGLL